MELTNITEFPNCTEICTNVTLIFILLHVWNNFMYWLSYSGLSTEQDGCMGTPKLTVPSNGALEKLHVPYRLLEIWIQAIIWVFLTFVVYQAGISAPHLYSRILHPLT